MFGLSGGPTISEGVQILQYYAEEGVEVFEPRGTIFGVHVFVTDCNAKVASLCETDTKHTAPSDLEPLIEL